MARTVNGALSTCWAEVAMERDQDGGLAATLRRVGAWIEAFDVWTGWGRGSALFSVGILIVPYKANAKYRHHIPKQKRKLTNWPTYEAGLRQRAVPLDRPELTKRPPGTHKDFGGVSENLSTKVSAHSVDPTGFFAEAIPQFLNPIRPRSGVYGKQIRPSENSGSVW